jgi:hypothetical protein
VVADSRRSVQHSVRAVFMIVVSRCACREPSRRRASRRVTKRARPQVRLPRSRPGRRSRRRTVQGRGSECQRGFGKTETTPRPAAQPLPRDAQRPRLSPARGTLAACPPAPWLPRRSIRLSASHTTRPRRESRATACGRSRCRRDHPIRVFGLGEAAV